MFKRQFFRVRGADSVTLVTGLYTRVNTQQITVLQTDKRLRLGGIRAKKHIIFGLHVLRPPGIQHHRTVYSLSVDIQIIGVQADFF